MEKLTHWKQNFNYKYAGAYELAPGETKTLTIKHCGKEDVMSINGDKQNCLVVYFSESSKPMVLNKTNCKTIEKLYGPFVETWVGKRIIIESKKVKAFGEEVDALRVKKVAPAPLVQVDYSGCINKLKACKSLEELKTVYTSFSPEEQAATATTKDGLKGQLK